MSETLDVRGAARTHPGATEVTLYFDRPLTNEEMLSVRERFEKMMNNKDDDDV
jgi:hypothetical protein